jgi:hypothetical protein
MGEMPTFVHNSKSTYPCNNVNIIIMKDQEHAAATPNGTEPKAYIVLDDMIWFITAVQNKHGDVYNVSLFTCNPNKWDNWFTVEKGTRPKLNERGVHGYPSYVQNADLGGTTINADMYDSMVGTLWLLGGSDGNTEIIGEEQ